MDEIWRKQRTEHIAKITTRNIERANTELEQEKVNIRREGIQTEIVREPLQATKKNTDKVTKTGKKYERKH